MREIKFRGWDVQRNEWVYGYYYTFGERAFIIEPGKPGIPEQHIEVKPASVGQFIGLHDKNGKEIYEGDILERRQGKGLAARTFTNEVFFTGGGFAIRFESGSAFLGQLTFGIEKVIGNIYEDAYLLK